MNAVLAKILTSLLGVVLSSLTPQLLASVFAKVKTSLPTIKGVIFSQQLEMVILKTLGYSSLPALAVGILNYAMVNDAQYIKNTTLCYFATATFGMIISSLRATYGGVDPSLATPSPTVPSTPPAPAPAAPMVPTPAEPTPPEHEEHEHPAPIAAPPPAAQPPAPLAA